MRRLLRLGTLSLYVLRDVCLTDLVKNGGNFPRIAPAQRTGDDVALLALLLHVELFLQICQRLELRFSPQVKRRARLPVHPSHEYVEMADTLVNVDRLTDRTFNRRIEIGLRQAEAVIIE